MFFQHQTPEEEVLRNLEAGGVVGIRDCVATGQFTVYYYKDIYMANGIFVRTLIYLFILLSCMLFINEYESS